MRINKYLAASGICSRRDAERLVLDSRVSINNEVVTNLSTTVKESDVVMLDGKLVQINNPRLWLYYKPVGLVVSHKDENDRETVFDYLKSRLKLNHLISVGRLDLNSEGLLLITNSGELAHKLEQPNNGYIRSYYVRIYGNNLPYRIKNISRNVKYGIEIDSIKYGPIGISFLNNEDSFYKGFGYKNIWVQVDLHEGKNREIRKIFNHFDLEVNRLIRFRYGPYYIDENQDLVEVDLKLN